MTRRRAQLGFTLLELTLAMLIGSIMVTAALGVFGALARADRAFESRADQTSQSEIIYLVAQRALRGLVVERPASQEEVEELGAPRLVLEPDLSADLPRMTEPGWSSQVILIGSERDRPQRLEVVVDRQPIMSDLMRASPDVTAEQLGLDPELFQPVAVAAERGAFELRPNGLATTGKPKWRLIWRPMIPMLDEEGVTRFFPAPEGYEVELASDITFLRWQAFVSGDRLLKHTCTQVLELPAYVELELQMAGGTMANWMFEIAWTIGPEVMPEEPESPGEGEPIEAPGEGAIGGEGEGTIRGTPIPLEGGTDR